MTEYRPPIVVALDFETAVGEVSRAIYSEGSTILATDRCSRSFREGSVRPIFVRTPSQGVVPGNRDRNAPVETGRRGLASDSIRDLRVG